MRPAPDLVEVGGGADGLHGGKRQGPDVGGLERVIQRMDAGQGIVQHRARGTGGLYKVLRSIRHTGDEFFLHFVALGVLVYLEETEHHWLLCENRKRR
ncbi:hypothetical protein D3C71_1308430 [compost metagenome]